MGEVEVAVPESYADDLGLGMEAERRTGNDIHKAMLVSISPEIQNNQVIGRVRFAQSPPAGLRQNQRLTTRILLELKEDKEKNYRWYKFLKLNKEYHSEKRKTKKEKWIKIGI